MTTTYTIITAFSLGILGSFHCLGMCGPIALTLSSQLGKSGLKGALMALMYNTGRIFTYGVLGMTIGFFGEALNMAGLQRGLSILAGSIVLIYLLYTRIYLLGSNRFISMYFGWIRNQLAKLYKNKTTHSYFLIGILNGLLPCGFVYLAIAGALAEGNVLKSTLFMVAFGIGTLPMMYGISFFGKLFSVTFQHRISKASPYMMLLLSVLLIVRGLNLGVPYLSPKAELINGTINSCCHRQ